MPSDAAPKVRLSIAAEFPLHFFLENIAVRQDNSMLITVATKQQLFFVPPPRVGEVVKPVLLHTFGELAAGIAELEPDVFIVMTGSVYTTHENYLHRLDLRGWTPGSPVRPETILTLPKEVLALNGCCALSPRTMLAADFLGGAIWRIDFGAEASAPEPSLWLRHESMAHIKDTLPPPTQPGINGVRYSAARGYVYYTTTGQKLFNRVRVDPTTFSPVGEPELIASGGMYDDFCIDDERGVAYLTVHRENRIDQVPLEPTRGAVHALAGEPLNDILLGPSSGVWSREPSEAGRVVYVTTDGGQTAPPPDGPKTAKLLRMELLEN